MKRRLEPVFMLVLNLVVFSLLVLACTFFSGGSEVAAPPVQARVATRVKERSAEDSAALVRSTVSAHGALIKTFEFSKRISVSFEAAIENGLLILQDLNASGVAISLLSISGSQERSWQFELGAEVKSGAFRRSDLANLAQRFVAKKGTRAPVAKAPPRKTPAPAVEHPKAETPAQPVARAQSPLLLVGHFSRKGEKVWLLKDPVVDRIIALPGNEDWKLSSEEAGGLVLEHEGRQYFQAFSVSSR